jgi:hypothetical protein
LSANGNTSSDSVVLVALETGSQANRLIVEGAGGADTGATVGRLGEVLSELAVGGDLADSSD